MACRWWWLRKKSVGGNWRANKRTRIGSSRFTKSACVAYLADGEANKISRVVGGFAVVEKIKYEKETGGWGGFYIRRTISMRTKKADLEGRMSRVPWLTLESDTSVPANETAHVCSKNVNMPEVSDSIL